MPDQEPKEEAEESSTARRDDSATDRHSKEHAEQFTSEWFAGIGAGMKGVSRKLLDHVPPELREKVAERARSQGPGSAATVVQGAALKARGFKTKLALKTLAKVLRMLDSKSS